jgi:hypothetical protein
MPDITFPSADGAAWSSAYATEAGFDCSGIEKAVEFAQAHETSWSRDVAAVIANSYFEPPPWNAVSRTDRTTRRAKWPCHSLWTPRRALGRHAAGRYDV